MKTRCALMASPEPREVRERRGCRDRRAPRRPRATLSKLPPAVKGGPGAVRCGRPSRRFVEDSKFFIATSTLIALYGARRCPCVRSCLLAEEDPSACCLCARGTRPPLHGGVVAASVPIEPRQKGAFAAVPRVHRRRAQQAEDSRTPRSMRRPRDRKSTSELQSRQYLVCRLLLEKK